MFVGKIVAGLLGLQVYGVPGLVFGLVLGHLFDRALAGLLGSGSENLEQVKLVFFHTVFKLMGHIAKADGRISEDEIAHTQQVFQQLGLKEGQRLEAIMLFKEGTDPNFSVDAALEAFLTSGGAHPALKQTLMIFLMALALADHELDPQEQTALKHIGHLLGYGSAAVDELLRMAMAQDQFHDQAGHAAGVQGPSLSDAYAAIGVVPEATDAEVKRAYRKLMSQNHPDKLSARGVPEDMLKLATEKSQEIQAAYEMLRKSRGSGRAG